MAILSNIKVLWVTIIILILLNLTTLGALWVTRTHKPFPGYRDEHANRAFLHEKLNLGPDQLQKYRAIKRQHHQEMGAEMDTIRDLREKLMCQMQHRDLNDSAKLLMNEIGEKQSEIEQLNYKHFRQILALCDSGQKAIFVETMKNAFLPDRDNDRDRSDRRKDRPASGPGGK